MNSRVPRDQPSIKEQYPSDVRRERSGLRESSEATESVLLLLHPGPLQVRAPFRPLDSYLCEHTRGPRILLNTLSKHNYGLELVLKIR